MLAELLKGTDSELYYDHLRHTFPHLLQEGFTTAQIASSVKDWSLAPDGSVLIGTIPPENVSRERSLFEPGFNTVAISVAPLDDDENRWGLWFVLSGERDVVRFAWTGDIEEGRLSQSHTVSITFENDTANKQLIYSLMNPSVAHVIKWPPHDIEDKTITPINLDPRMQGELEGVQEGHKIQILTYDTDQETNAQMFLFEGFPGLAAVPGVIKLPLSEEPRLGLSGPYKT